MGSHAHATARTSRTSILCLIALCALASVGASCDRRGEPVQPAPEPRPAPSSALVLQSLPPELKQPSVTVLLRQLSRSDAITLKAEAGLWRVVRDGEAIAYSTPLTLTLRRQGERMDVQFKNAKAAWEQKLESLSLQPVERADSQPGPANVSGTLYEGSVNVTVGEGGWEVTNIVDMEAYVRGSTGWEAVPSWPVEALKAQAVAIRSYTLHTLLKQRESGQVRGWSVDDTTAYLKYGGIGPADKPAQQTLTPGVRQAQEATRGEVLTFQDKVVKTYFHSTSGGATTDAAHVFGDPSIAPLAGAGLGNYGASSPMYRWTNRLKRAELESALSARGEKLGTITTIRTQRACKAGFAAEVAVTGTSGSVAMSAAEFRRVVGTGRDRLPSTNFNATVVGEEIIFTGRGWGHGVGMDQWAASDMAKEGLDYRAILAKSYPQAVVHSAW